VFFLGTFDYAMDERGRVPLPPRYRDAFREGIVLSQGSPDRCLRVYTQASFSAQAEEFTSQPAMHRKGRDLRKALFSRSHEAELDKQNRVLIPAALREYAGLSGKVLVVGAGEWLEVWSPAAYVQEMTRVDADLETTLESIEPRE
jgi:MraZ protein